MNTNMHRLPRRFIFAAFLAVFCLLLAGSLPGRTEEAPPRLVAIGDIHGDYDALVGLLRRAGLLDGESHWAGGNAVLVQVGDEVDRGPKDRDVMDLLMRLEKEAPRQGGRVVVLLGNHEMLNLMGDMTYVSPQSFAQFAGKDSEQRRQQAYRQYVKFLQARAKTQGLPAPTLTEQQEKTWMDAHPPGYFERREAFGPEGKYNQWLRTHDGIAQIGGTIFIHGGISPALTVLSIEAINKRLREEIGLFEQNQQDFVEQGLILPFYTLSEITDAAQAELDRWNAQVGRKTAEAKQKGKAYRPDLEEEKDIDRLTHFLRYPNWLSFHPDGPLWFRGYAQWPDELGNREMDKLLAKYKAERIVGGHTPQYDGRIHVRFGGKVIFIDTGMLAGYISGGRPSALEIVGDQFTAVYPDSRVPLMGDRAATPAEGGAARPEEEEQPGGPLATDNQGQAESPAKPAPAPKHFWLDANGQPLPFQSDDEIIAFLQTAKVTKMKEVPTGITHPQKVLLEKDGVQMNAVFRNINEEQTMARMATGTEMLFRDSYIFEPPAYELSRMLGLNAVPPAVLRKVRGESGSIQVWVEKTMTEGERLKQKIGPPDAVRWNHQIQNMRIFDNLVYNTDRNMGNILIDDDWRVWWIDHTRAFRRQETLNNPQGILQCDRKLYAALQALDPAEVHKRLSPFLRKPEIEAILKRRDKIVEIIRSRIAELGEDKVLYDTD